MRRTLVQKNSIELIGSGACNNTHVKWIVTAVAVSNAPYHYPSSNLTETTPATTTA